MLAFTGHTAPVRAVAYAPTGRRLASGSEDGTVRLWDPGRGEAQVVNATAGVEALAYTPDGSVLVAGLATGGLIAFDRLGTRKRWTSPGHAGGVRAVCPHPDNVRATTTGWDRAVTVWPFGKAPVSLTDRLPEPPGAMAITPDGRTVAVGLGGTGRVLLRTGSRGERTIDGSGAGVHALAFAADGTVLAVGDAAGGLTVYTAEFGRFVRAFVGHTWTVYGLGFTPDGRRLVSGGADGTVRIWDADTGRCQHVYQWHATWVTCLAVAPDGLTVATGGNDKVVAVWDMPE
ncbi:MAG TPA: WD40 repeat domain-containing protein [Gemmataceae bacterium]|nr:WD40 repeat domain-containing protein [Gemmataceae bacterium]